MNRKSLLLAGVALMMSFTLSAQPQRGARAPGGERRAQAPKTAEEMAQGQTDKLKTALQLKDDQAKKLYEVNLKYANLAKESHDKMKADREALGKQMQQRKAEFEAILSPAQKTAFEVLHPQRGQGKPEQGARMEQGRAPRHGAGHGQGHHSRRGAMKDPEMMAKAGADKCKTLLQLSDDQTKKVYDLNLKYSNIASAAFDDSKKSGMEMMKKLSGKKAEVEAIFTPEQKAAYEEIQKAERMKMEQMRKYRSPQHDRGRQGGGMPGGGPRT